jgi:hypothetical protein
MMVCLIHLSRFFFAATALVAALLLVSSGAQAHAGHSHGPVKVERFVPTPPISGSVQTRDGLRSEESGAHSTVWIAAASPANGKATTSCMGGCCHSAGQGCCAAVLPAFNVALPPCTLERLFAHFLWGPGITPGVLPEPPNNLV